MDRKRSIRLVLSIIWLAALTVLSLLPAAPVPPVLRWWEHTDKIGHAVAYGVLAWLFFGTVRLGRNSGRFHAAVAVACVLYGMLMELCQVTMWPGVRECSVGDMASNTAGVAIAWIVVRVAKLRQKDGQNQTESNGNIPLPGVRD